MNQPEPKIRITRANPGLVLLLVDRSYSMETIVADDGRPLAQVVADAVNETLHNLCLHCILDPVEGPRPYFEIGLIGYGRSANQDDAQAVEPAFGGALLGRELVTSAELAHHPIRVVERSGGIDLDGQTVMVPEWLEPLAGFATPMCEAVYQAGRLASDFCARNPESYPPIVINLTDGEVTDEPFAPSGDQHPVGLDDWASRLTALKTKHGSLRFLNAYVTSVKTDSTWFPNSPDSLPQAGRRLFDISSPLPDDLAAEAARRGKWGGPGARALLVNASPDELTAFLEIGTTYVDASIGD